MKPKKISLLIFTILFVNFLAAQNIKLSEDLLEAVGSSMNFVNYKEENSVKVQRSSVISGTIGFWIVGGTEGCFADLKIE
jgi:hypothetical protein